MLDAIVSFHLLYNRPLFRETNSNRRYVP